MYIYFVCFDYSCKANMKGIDHSFLFLQLSDKDLSWKIAASCTTSLLFIHLKFLPHAFRGPKISHHIGIQEKVAAGS